MQERDRKLKVASMYVYHASDFIIRPISCFRTLGFPESHSYISFTYNLLHSGEQQDREPTSRFYRSTSICRSTRDARAAITFSHVFPAFIYLNDRTWIMNFNTNSDFPRNCATGRTNSNVGNLAFRKLEEYATMFKKKKTLYRAFSLSLWKIKKQKKNLKDSEYSRDKLLHVNRSLCIAFQHLRNCIVISFYMIWLVTFNSLRYIPFNCATETFCQIFYLTTHIAHVRMFTFDLSFLIDAIEY